MVVLLLPVLLQGPEVLLREGLLLDGQRLQAGGRLGRQLVEEVEEGAGIDLAGHHADILTVHHFDVGHGALVQPGVGGEELVQELVPCGRLGGD